MAEMNSNGLILAKSWADAGVTVSSEDGALVGSKQSVIR